MSVTREQAKELLRAKGLRSTSPRVALLKLLAEASSPLAHSEVVELLADADCDPATVYRNLVKLTEVGITNVVSHAEGMARYALVALGHSEHRHPHFVCETCGRVSCLPDSLGDSLKVEGRWARSVEGASLQLRGECPECLGVGSAAVMEG
jgi:Fur family ferric uptake transcriptional regulator